MVALSEQQASAQKRLTLETAEIAEDTTVLRSLDWDRDRFDIEFGLQNGTTYNSFLIRGDKVALIDTSHEKFEQLYLQTLQGLIDPSILDYIIISHTEPDHSGLVRKVLALAPQATVVGAKVALQFLDDLVHHPYEKQVVKNGDQLDLGDGHVLEFVSAPNLHWPDTMFTYDRRTQILYTCDAFGMHYCSQETFDQEFAKLEPDFRFYYECLMAPNSRSVLSAMKRMSALGDIQIIATGHGPILKHHIPQWLNLYETWSQAKSKAETLAAVFYVSDYGYSDRISQAVAHGITKTEVGVEMMDLKSADVHDIQELVSRAKGLVITMPPVSGPIAAQCRSAVGTILASVTNKQAIGFVESYGGDDEPIDPLLNKFRELGLKDGFDPIRIKLSPTDVIYQLCEEAGTDFGQMLGMKQKIQKAKAQDNQLQKALGRLSGGLYILTAQKGDVKGAMLASWVAQASFEPLGFTVAVAKDRAIESLMQVGDRFALNVLEEGKHLPLMKHFLKRFPPGADRFEGVNTQRATHGSPVLADALAYMECRVTSRMECSDHWLVYSQVEEGRVSNPNGQTAVHHRKVGSYY
ncbi:diflavin flavoprotein [Lyngbya confervoides]|uniref:Diflavin flavoprotein n=1 Tax=Lyngbya confervoides BDU141951 TaxID=1574623 RepID=A0ABD4T4U0_9CYAN|nr:diflavin flavoprotein [Lyngbya confervoides]MCM1983609.1 diflavin flavoprotein [Lyngbya confervoides BDU141951]